MTTRLEMRVALRRGSKTALYFSASYVRGELHMAAHSRVPVPGLDDTATLFRSTYHASGQAHGKLRNRRVTEPEYGVPLTRITGRIKVGGISGMVDQLDWSYKPKQDSESRRTLVLDIDAFADVPWSVEFWAIEQGRPELVDEVVREDASIGDVVNHMLVDHTSPQFLLVARRLSDSRWEALRHLIEDQQ